MHLFLKSSFLLSSLTFIFTKVLKSSNASRRGSHATWLNFLLLNLRPTSQTSVYIQNFVWCHFSFWIRSWPRSSTKHPVLHDFTFYKRWGEDVRMLRWTKFKMHQKMDSYPQSLRLFWVPLSHSGTSSTYCHHSCQCDFFFQVCVYVYVCVCLFLKRHPRLGAFSTQRVYS